MNFDVLSLDFSGSAVRKFANFIESGREHEYRTLRLICNGKLGKRNDNLTIFM